MTEFPDVPVSAVTEETPLLDIREQDEWDRGHAPTAVHVPMSELPVRLDELAPFLDRDEPLVVTCRSGGRVQRVLPYLEQHGYEVANLEGGMLAWAQAGRPLEGSDGEPAVM